ncbi:LmrCD-specific DARPin-like protein [Dinothrombium tinctorium]|uniref:Alpha-latrotoxin n=1 Tax=Dinothrombium tinctorium TaxID=1965070 RepID=A0A3S3R0K7_9ACAR|nr:LmrCD-specific DARPin-like protein [Dinothrombium tinctorium]
MNAKRTIFDVIRDEEEEFIEEKIASGKYDLNAVDSHGYSPIFLAADDGNEFLIDLLVKHGAAFSDDCRPKDFPCDPLHIATKRGHLHVVELLVERGANVNAIDAAGKPPIWYALTDEEYDVFDFLLDNGANIRRIIPESFENTDIGSIEFELYNNVTINDVKIDCFTLDVDEEGTNLKYFIVYNVIDSCHPLDAQNFIELFCNLLSTQKLDISEEFRSKVKTSNYYSLTMRRNNFSYELIKHDANVEKCSLHFYKNSFPSLKTLLDNGYLLEVHFFLQNCDPLTPEFRNEKRELKVTCYKLYTDEERYEEEDHEHDLYAFRNFLECLNWELRSPFRLKVLCRIAIRTRFGHVINNIEPPLLPKELKDFLLFHDQRAINKRRLSY